MDGLVQVQECMVTDRLISKMRDTALVYHSRRLWVACRQTVFMKSIWEKVTQSNMPW